MYVYEWDETKRQQTLTHRNVDFADVVAFDWDTALTAPDTRDAYGEVRYISAGLMRDRLHILVWTDRGTTRRVISLRKANAREISRYGQAQDLSG